MKLENYIHYYSITTGIFLVFLLLNSLLNYFSRKLKNQLRETMKDEKYKININKLEFANKILDKVFIVMVFILVFNLHYLIFGISLHLGNYFYFVKGDYKKAENTYKTALKIENKLIGQYPPIISDLLFKLYESCIMQKKYKEAKYYFDQASIII